MNVKVLLSGGKRLVDHELSRYLPTKGKLARAMCYSVFAGGKRFRPLLCLATARALGCSEKRVLPYACAVELIHTFTLIHDDLPAMDDSDLRRGKPTSHKVYGEALAILAGDALNTLAFKVIADQPEAVKELSNALLEVVEGQVADVESAKLKTSLKELKAIHKWKTGALLKACVRGTARICQASSSKVKALTKYAEHLGLAFQIADDILDATATAKHLGKPVKADIKKGFPYLIGLERSKKMVAEEKKRALETLTVFGRQAELLRGIVDLYVLPK
ncbi:MAG: polyprenyl synthetase family protein [Candidatus Margulisbacteria bacterium]|nr:polyprenyl synthetase family protein [Candidatus Margulisiibacteriota bacterium]